MVSSDISPQGVGVHRTLVQYFALSCCSKMIKVPSKFVRTFAVNFMGEQAFRLQNKAAKDAKHENTIFTTTTILLQREARQARGDSWLVSADICGNCLNFWRKPS